MAAGDAAQPGPEGSLAGPGGGPAAQQQQRRRGALRAAGDGGRAVLCGGRAPPGCAPAPCFCHIAYHQEAADLRFSLGIMPCTPWTVLRQCWALHPIDFHAVIHHILLLGIIS